MKRLSIVVPTHVVALVLTLAALLAACGTAKEVSAPVPGDEQDVFGDEPDAGAACSDISGPGSGVDGGEQPSEPSRCVDADGPLACMATPGCYWDGERGICRSPEALAPGRLPATLDLAGSHGALARIEGVRRLPSVPDASVVLSLYSEGARLLGTLVVEAVIEGEGYPYGYRVEGSVSEDDGQVRLVMSERRCVVEGDLCEGTESVDGKRVYESLGAFEAEELVFGPATLSQGLDFEVETFVPESPFTSLRFAPHDGFKPAEDPGGPIERNGLAGHWRGGFSYLGAGLEGENRSYAACDLAIVEGAQGYRLHEYACPSLPGHWSVEEESLAYDGLSRRFWFKVSTEAGPFVFIGTLEVGTLSGIVAREDAETPRYWRSDELPSSAIAVDFADVVGVLRFDAIRGEEH